MKRARLAESRSPRTLLAIARSSPVSESWNSRPRPYLAQDKPDRMNRCPLLIQDFSRRVSSSCHICRILRSHSFVSPAFRKARFVKTLSGSQSESMDANSRSESESNLLKIPILSAGGQSLLILVAVASSEVELGGGSLKSSANPQKSGYFSWNSLEVFGISIRVCGNDEYHAIGFLSQANHDVVF